MEPMDVFMLESPFSLQEICIEYICNNFEVLFKLTAPNDELPSTSGGVVAESVKLSSQNEKVHLHGVLLEQLMFRLSKKQKLTDRTMTLFDTSYIVFRYIKLNNASAVTCRGFSNLKQLKIPKLEVTNMGVAVNNLIDNLGKWTLDKLLFLNVSNSLKFSKSAVVSILSCSNLQGLNVSGTDFDTQCLEIVVDGLPHLKALDISRTSVDDISSLLRCKDRLTSLSIYALEAKEEVTPILKEMHKLRELDCSGETNSFHINFSIIADHLPNLISLDISGQSGLYGLELMNFLEKHTELYFLGSLMTSMCSEDVLMDPANPLYNPNLKVAGFATERQLLEALRHYKNRPGYAAESLCNLAQWEKPAVDAVFQDLFKAVLSVMEDCSKWYNEQLAALDCLLKMTKGSLIEQIHPNTLSHAVNLVLALMKNNTNSEQILRRSLQFLCKERILEDISFDRYHFAQLVAQNLVATSTQSVVRTCITILNYLVRKITTQENSCIGTHPRFMSKLLLIIRSMLKTYNVDQTVKCTLSTLWSITDESPANCRIFVKEGGIKLFMKVLKEFEEDRDIEESVLGIFSNVVEVASLRPKLMTPDFVVTLRKLLHSGHMEVSYFAAMIISHLACDGIASWTVNIISRQQILEEMETVILNWKPPKEELVSYRTLQSFLPLLKCHDPYQVQLWAVWDLWHICRLNGRRYSPMVASLKIKEILLQLQANDDVNNEVRRICSSILDSLTKESVKSTLQEGNCSSS